MNAPLTMPRFLPIPTTKGSRAKQRKTSAAFRNALLDLLSEDGPMGSRDLAELTGSTVNTVRDYLQALMKSGLVESEKVKGRNHPTGGTVMCMYRIVVDDLPTHQSTATGYSRNQVSDPYALPAAFFAQQQ